MDTTNENQTSSKNVSRRSIKRRNRPKKLSQTRIQRPRSEKVVTARIVGYSNFEAMYAIHYTPFMNIKTIELLMTVMRQKLKNVIRREGRISEITVYFSERMIAKLKNRHNRLH
ncbi:Hypothetical protein CINCED_3A017418 [Cinara cedri]|uniref:Uncharacterized protein n=1 Tax=Cinara cedri TaxID=506608 RepID=A0A5E4N3J8_9HEMI|nr:Hypothetical protein CINCED_3A017418 [Cinara cedri]